MAYNGKMIRIREEATRILRTREGKALGLPDVDGVRQMHLAVSAAAPAFMVLPFVGQVGSTAEALARQDDVLARAERGTSGSELAVLNGRE